MKTNTRFGLSALFVVLVIALPAMAYEFPLSADAIRQAYFLGSGQKGKDSDFYSKYSHSRGEPKNDPPGSIVTIDTPYLQIAEHSRDTSNYHSQDAQEDFFDKPAEFRLFLDVYYKPVNDTTAKTTKKKAGSSDSGKILKIRLIQHEKEISWRTVESWPFYPFHDAQTSVERDGEHWEIACDAALIDSSVLTIKIDIPNGQQFETDFDLWEIK